MIYSFFTEEGSSFAYFSHLRQLSRSNLSLAMRVVARKTSAGTMSVSPPEDVNASFGNPHDSALFRHKRR